MSALISNFKLESLIQPDLRSAIATLIEAHAQAMEDLIALLDAFDGDPTWSRPSGRQRPR